MAKRSSKLMKVAMTWVSTPRRNIAAARLC
jgi:hypothetical protein